MFKGIFEIRLIYDQFSGVPKEVLFRPIYAAASAEKADTKKLGQCEEEKV
jgi:hypothetical protein